jgi:hypothetical protein
MGDGKSSSASGVKQATANGAPVPAAKKGNGKTKKQNDEAKQQELLAARISELQGIRDGEREQEIEIGESKMAWSHADGFYATIWLTYDCRTGGQEGKPRVNGIYGENGRHSQGYGSSKPVHSAADRSKTTGTGTQNH